MKPSTRDILFIFIGLFISIGTLWASKAGSEIRLGRDVAYLNTLGRTPGGERSLSQSLHEKFGADAVQIESLKKRRLGYGDISVVMALASRLHGGISRLNIERIVSMWRPQRSMTWGRIARNLGVRVEKVVLQVEGLRARPAGSVAHNGPARTGTKGNARAVSSRSGYDPVLRLVHGG